MQPPKPEAIKIRVYGHVTVARIEIENLMGLYEVNRIQEMLEQIVDGGSRRLIVDLKHVVYAGSASLGMLLAVHKKMKALSGRLVLSHVENIDSLLKISRTDRIFTIAPDAKAAMALLE